MARILQSGFETPLYAPDEGWEPFEGGSEYYSSGGGRTLPYSAVQGSIYARAFASTSYVQAWKNKFTSTPYSELWGRVAINPLSSIPT